MPPPPPSKRHSKNDLTYQMNYNNYATFYHTFAIDPVKYWTVTMPELYIARLHCVQGRPQDFLSVCVCVGGGGVRAKSSCVVASRVRKKSTLRKLFTML